MIKIGFEETFDPNDKEAGQKMIDETKSVIKHRDVYISDKTKNRLLEEYDTVAVYDYGDDYHIPEDELRARNKFYDAFRKINNKKKKYNRLDDYVDAMRKVLYCLDLVAQNNFVYAPDVFKQKWLNGEIEISGLDRITYKGKDRKRINWKYVIDFILSDRDPKEILETKEDDEYMTEEQIHAYYDSLFDEKELNYLLDHSNDAENEIKFCNNILDRKLVAAPAENKSKKLFKEFPEVIVGLKHYKKSRDDADIAAEYGTNLTYEDMEQIQRYDVQQNFKNSSNNVMPVYKGSLLDDDEFDSYMWRLRQWNDEHIKENYSGKMKSMEEINELEIKEVLQSNGWNIRKLYDNERELEKRKEQKKQAEKNIKKIKKRLTKMTEEKKKLQEEHDSLTGRNDNKKKKRKMGDYYNDYDTRRRRKTKKGKKKNKN